MGSLGRTNTGISRGHSWNLLSVCRAGTLCIQAPGGRGAVFAGAPRNTFGAGGGETPNESILSGCPLAHLSHGAYLLGGKDANGAPVLSKSHAHLCQEGFSAAKTRDPCHSDLLAGSLAEPKEAGLGHLSGHGQRGLWLDGHQNCPWGSRKPPTRALHPRSATTCQSQRLTASPGGRPRAANPARLSVSLRHHQRCTADDGSTDSSPAGSPGYRTALGPYSPPPQERSCK